MWRGALAVLSILLVTGCGGPEYEPGEDRCPRGSLPEGAVLSYSSGSAWHGSRIWHIVAFGDGRLVLNGTTNANVPAERITRLLNDVAATGVEDEDEGCYWGAPEEHTDDSSSSSLHLREGLTVRMWSESSPGEPPDAVRGALAVMDAFRRELVDANVVPEQKK